MSVMAAVEPTEDLSRLEGGANSYAPGSRQVWEEKRRSMERQNIHFGPDGLRSAWRGRAFSSVVRLFGLGTRLVGAYERGKRNALKIRLVDVSLSFPDLPLSFDGYRILHLSDTHLDCLPELAPIAARLHTIAGPRRRSSVKMLATSRTSLQSRFTHWLAVIDCSQPSGELPENEICRAIIA